VTQNGLNLLGISPYAFKMIVGAVILVAISLSNAPLAVSWLSAERGVHDRRRAGTLARGQPPIRRLIAGPA
jgi:hypothetical protein